MRITKILTFAIFTELLRPNGGRLELKQLLFTYDTALVADSEKLHWLVGDFARACERRKLRVNIGKSKVIRYSMYVNVGQMVLRLNGEPL